MHLKAVRMEGTATGRGGCSARLGGRRCPRFRPEPGQINANRHDDGGTHHNGPQARDEPEPLKAQIPAIDTTAEQAYGENPNGVVGVREFREPHGEEPLTVRQAAPAGRRLEEGHGRT